MLKKTGCLISIIAVMLFLTFISIRQGYNTIYNDNWNDNYIQKKGVVSSIYKDSSYMMSNGTGSWTYSFEPIVEYTFKNEVQVDTLIWFRSLEESQFYPRDSIDVLINKNDGKLSEDSDQDREGTGVVNIIQGLFFFLIAYFIFRYLRKIKKNNANKNPKL